METLYKKKHLKVTKTEDFSNKRSLSPSSLLTTSLLSNFDDSSNELIGKQPPTVSQDTGGIQFGSSPILGGVLNSPNASSNKKLKTTHNNNNNKKSKSSNNTTPKKNQLELNNPTNHSNYFNLDMSSVIPNSSTCAGCDRPILDQYVYNVLDRTWHQNCIQCSDCKLSLNEKCFSRDGKIFCKEDFLR